jgi:hypothetical protein
MVTPARLAGIPLFAGLAEADLAAISSAASEVHAAEGQDVATEGEFGHGICAIESGTAEVRLHGAGPTCSELIALLESLR